MKLLESCARKDRQGRPRHGDERGEKTQEDRGGLCVCDGFIGNRMVEQYLRQALFLLEEGATPSQVDSALESWGMAMGLSACRIWRQRHRLAIASGATRAARFEVLEDRRSVMRKGRFARRRGWLYRYVAGRAMRSRIRPSTK